MIKISKLKKCAPFVIAAILIIVVAVIVCKTSGSDKKTDKPKNTTAPVETEAVEEGYIADFEPHAVEATRPDKLIKSTDISVNGELTQKYKGSQELGFKTPEYFTSLQGISLFRGNNFRNSASYGTADVQNKQLTQNWTAVTGGIFDADENYWTGSGWTGQPLIVTWPKETRAIMSSMYDWAREKDSLTEVIYPCMDGRVHFYELESGEMTRDELNLGYTFKGTGAIDPRGYPILYIGSGLDSTQGSSRAFIVNLIDFSVMYEFGNKDDFALRPWHMFDASPLVCAEADTLIYPGENGVLYIIHLNTKFDEKTGELSVNPDNVVKWRYDSTRNGVHYWLGVESSPAIINHYIYMADNGGNLMCLDLNTLKLVWVQDTLDDTNTTPVVDIEDGHPYLYVSTSFHYGWRSYNTATVPVWKIDAETGEIVWQADYECYSVDGVSGGVQGTIAVGKNNLSDLIFVPIARTPTIGQGLLVALDKHTGKQVWEKETLTYSWSSPADFYDAEGNGYLIYCNSGYYIYMVDGKTGETLSQMDLGGNIEASPAVFNNYAVVGHRGQRIFCLNIT